MCVLYLSIVVVQSTQVHVVGSVRACDRIFVVNSSYTCFSGASCSSVLVLKLSSWMFLCGERDFCNAFVPDDASVPPASELRRASRHGLPHEPHHHRLRHERSHHRLHHEPVCMETAVRGMGRLICIFHVFQRDFPGKEGKAEMRSKPR